MNHTQRLNEIAGVPRSLLKLVGGKFYKYDGRPCDFLRVHRVIARTNKRPKRCQVCLKKPLTRIEWANVTGVYDENIKNYKAMCTPCHKNFDNGYKPGHCSSGHKLVGKDVYITPQGWKRCRPCKRVRMRIWKAKRKLLLDGEKR